MDETRMHAGLSVREARSALGVAAEDYLKNIYKLTWSDRHLTPSMLAERMAVSPAAVSKMLKRLQELKLVNYVRNGELSLTHAGEKVALEIIRHHRLLEAYLMEALGYTWDQVDEEAEKLEHVISEEFEDRIDRFLGYPTHDPHGDPIPTKDGHLPRTKQITLSSLDAGENAVISRVSDGDPDMLRYMGRLGLYPDTSVEMVHQEPYGGPLRIRVSGQEHAIGGELADNVFVTRKEMP